MTAAALTGLRQFRSRHLLVGRKAFGAHRSCESTPDRSGGWPGGVFATAFLCLLYASIDSSDGQRGLKSVKNYRRTMPLAIPFVIRWFQRSSICWSSFDDCGRLAGRTHHSMAGGSGGQPLLEPWTDSG